MKQLYNTRSWYARRCLEAMIGHKLRLAIKRELETNVQYTFSVCKAVPRSDDWTHTPTGNTKGNLNTYTMSGARRCLEPGFGSKLCTKTNIPLVNKKVPAMSTHCDCQNACLYAHTKLLYEPTINDTNCVSQLGFAASSIPHVLSLQTIVDRT